MSAPREIPARCLVAGTAEGATIVLDAPLSLWGGFDPVSGRIIDVHHPQHGERIAGRVLLMPGGRGSSSSASILLEAVRQGRHPLAIVLGETDPVLVVGALVAADLYGVHVPVICLDGGLLPDVPDGATARVSAAPEASALQLT